MIDADRGGGQDKSLTQVVSTEQVEQSISDLDENRRDELLTVLVSHEVHSGPIPSPKALAGYEVVSPGLGREIVDMAVRQQAHDHNMQQRVLRSESGYRILTLTAATTVVLTMVGGSVFLGFSGHDTASYVLGAASGLTLLAGVFIKGRDLSFRARASDPLPSRTSNRPLLAAATFLPRNDGPMRLTLAASLLVIGFGCGGGTAGQAGRILECRNI